MKVTMNIRTDSKIKSEAMELFETLGLDLSTAINIFLRQAIIRQGMPFDISIDDPNEESLEALAEIREFKANPKKATRYRDVGIMMEEILNEV